MRDTITRIIEEVHRRYAGTMDGSLADYIPELTRADPNHFGIAVVTADGYRYAVGDVDVPFTIQSVSKAFTYGMALDHRGAAAVEERVGVEPSGEAFNSISLDPGTGRPRNPMINAGAIAVTGMLPDREAEPRFEHIRSTFSRFAARELTWDDEVYASESATGFRNRAIANLLRSFDILDGPTDPVVEDYFRQCSLQVTCSDLATMAATLAHGGVNPVTGDAVLTLGNVEKVLSVMATCGMYDYSGTWVYEVGLPAKSGVGGGVLGVLPGQFGIALFSPLLDEKFNSVRGVAGFRDLSREFDLHLLRAPSMSKHAIRRHYRLSDVSSRRGRPDEDLELLAEVGRKVLVLELQGDLFAASLERVIRSLASDGDGVEVVVLDLRRAGATDGSTVGLLRGLAETVAAVGQHLVVTDQARVLPSDAFAGLDVEVARTLDDAMRGCEDALLGDAGRAPAGSVRLDLAEFELVRHLGDHERARLLPRFVERSYAAGEVIVEQGADADALYLLGSGVAEVEFADPLDGSVERIADLYPGVVIGELGLLGQGRRSATVRAVTDVACFELSRFEFFFIVRSYNVFYTRIIEDLLVSTAERLRRANREASLLRD
ncbi:MAG: glutaminase A [Nitriliruptor sp.]|nr:MAG: glutaminase A [Nitriliruptor sp.]